VLKAASKAAEGSCQSSDHMMSFPSMSTLLPVSANPNVSRVWVAVIRQCRTHPAAGKLLLEQDPVLRVGESVARRDLGHADRVPLEY
jgi:hypothetical protein